MANNVQKPANFNGNVTFHKLVPFETALNLTGFGKYNYFVLFVCSTSMLATLIELFSLAFIVQVASCDLGLTIEQRGLLSGLPMVGIMLTSYVWGYMTDTKGRKTVLLISMSTGFLFSFLSSFSPNVLTMTILKCLSVSFSSAAITSSYTLLGEFQPKVYRDKSLVFLTCANSISEFVIVLITYGTMSYTTFVYFIPVLEIHFLPWRLLVIFLSMPLAFSALCLLLVEESPKYMLSQRKEKEALRILKKVYSINSGRDGSSYTVQALEPPETVLDETFLTSAWKQMTEIFDVKYRTFFAVICFVLLCVGGINNAYSMWLPYIVNNFMQGYENKDLQNNNFCAVFSYSYKFTNSTETVNVCDDSIDDVTYIATALYSIGATILLFIFAYCTKALGKRTMLIGILSFTGFSGFLLNWVNIPMVGLVLFILFNYMYVAMGVLPAFIIEIYPTHVRGMAGCLSSMVTRCGSFIGISTIGLIFEQFCEETIYVSASAVIICAAISFSLPSNFNKKN